MVHHGEAKRQSIGSATFCVCPYDTANPSLPMKRPQVSSHSIPSSSGGAIDTNVFEPYTDATDTASRPVVIRGTIVLVYPWSALGLGAGEHNTIGLNRRITAGRGGGGRRQWWRAVTFALESGPAWRGGPLWGILLNHSHEVGQVVDVVDWVRKK